MEIRSSFLKRLFKGLFSQEIKDFQEQIQMKAFEICNLEGEIDVLKNDAVSLKSLSDDQEKLLAERDKEIVRLKETEASLMTATADQERLLADRDKEILRLKESEVSLRTVSDGQERQLAEMDKEILRLKDAETSLRAITDEQKRQLAERDKETLRLKEAEASLKSVAEEHIRLLAERDKEILRLNETEASLRAVANDQERLLAERDREILRLNETKSSLRADNDDQKRQLQDMDMEILRLKENEISLRADNGDQKRILEKKDEEIFRLKESEASLKIVFGEQERQLEERKKEILRLNETETSLRAVICDQERQIAESEEEILRLKDAEATLLMKIDYLTNTIKDLQNNNNAIESKEKEICNLKVEIIDLKSKIQKLEEGLKEANPKLTSFNQEGKEEERQGSEKRISAASMSSSNHIINGSYNSTSTYNNQNSKNTTDNAVRKTKIIKSEGVEYREEKKQQATRFIFPYRRKPINLISEVLSRDFPPIENENRYYNTNRTINRVFDHRINSLIDASSIFLEKTAEDISRIRMELEDAIYTGIPYLSCPCCGNPVKISSKSSGFGDNRKEVQFFTHAVRNIACDLKRTALTPSIDYAEDNITADADLYQLRNLLSDVLKMAMSKNKGVSQVKVDDYVISEELSIMKRRLADITAQYNELSLVFEFVKPNTNIAIFRDKEMFYYLNKKHVFWIFGLDSSQDYSELSRSVSKDILYRNRRNVFVFDSVAQIESKRRGELILKCNWLDENDEWYFQIKKQGTNGILVSLDELKYDSDNCYPYYFDAEEYYYSVHTEVAPPLKQSRGDLEQEIIDSWNYEMLIKEAVNKMSISGQSVQAYYDGSKWGFKYGDVVFIEPIFDEVTEFYGNFAKVTKDKKFGVVNRFGDIHLQPEHDHIELLPNGQILYAANDQWMLDMIKVPFARCYHKDTVQISMISGDKVIFRLIIYQTVGKQSKQEETYFIDNNIIRKDSATGKWFLWYSEGELVNKVLWDTFNLSPELNLIVKIGSSTECYDSNGILQERFQIPANNYLDIDILDSTTQVSNSCVSPQASIRREDNQRHKEASKKKNSTQNSQKNKKRILPDYRVGKIYIWKITNISRRKDGLIDYILIRDKYGKSLKISGKSINKKKHLAKSIFVDKSIIMRLVGYDPTNGISNWQWIVD